LICSWRMHMPRPIVCMTWGTSLAWQMSGCFGSQIKTLRGALLPNFSSQASQIRLVLLLCLSTWAKTKSQSSVLGKPEIPSELFHVLSQSWCWYRVWKQIHVACIEKNELRLVSQLLTW
jgi:hypothetical protein